MILGKKTAWAMDGLLTVAALILASYISGRVFAVQSWECINTIFDYMASPLETKQCLTSSGNFFFGYI